MRAPMAVFEQAKWIWPSAASDDDTYGEFYADICAKAHTVCRLSVDGDYTLFLNGRYIASNQYGDFEHYKIYDEIDLTPYLTGRDRLAFLVWHFGAPSQRYRPARAGLIFEVENDGKIIAVSGKDTPARFSRAYIGGRRQYITSQLGLSFAYDSTREDDWKTAENDGFTPATVVEKRCSFFPRPTERPVMLPPAPAAITRVDDRHYRVDLGRETVGCFALSCTSAVEQTLTVAWGEHLCKGGRVLRAVGGRNFTLKYHAGTGQNDFVNYMLRLGLRYLEIDGEAPFTIEYAGVMPQVYPAVARPAKLQDPTDQAIYDLCVRTLELCMMEHYVDCPWREQNLYGFDSRNQMTAGYDAFEGGNAAYVRANLKLFAADTRQDDLLSICAPCGNDLTIPSFSLHFVLAFCEYIEQTGDATLADEIGGKVEAILRFVLAQKKDGVLYSFAADCHWNFYDWSPYSDGSRAYAGRPDLILNAMTVLALTAYERICAATGRVFPFVGEANALQKAARERFWCDALKTFTMFDDGTGATELAATYAILSGIADKETAVALADKLAKGELIACALSSRRFKYEAMLAVDAGYRDALLAGIRADFGAMLTAGATSAWETDRGWVDFDEAGSLCHGWSGYPVSFYRRFGMVQS